MSATTVQENIQASTVAEKIEEVPETAESSAETSVQEPTSSLRQQLHEITFIRNMINSKMSSIQRDLGKLQVQLRTADSLERAAMANIKIKRLSAEMEDNAARVSESLSEKQSEVSKQIDAILHDEESAEKLEPISVNDIGKWISSYFHDVTMTKVNRACESISAYSVDDLRSNINLIINSVENAVEDLQDFTRRQCAVIMNDFLYHVLFSIQKRYADCKEKSETDVTKIDWSAFNRATKVVDELDTVSNDVMKLELQEAIEAKVIGYEPKLMNNELPKLSVQELVGMQELYDRYYAESFELTRDYELLMKHRNSDASKDDYKSQYKPGESPREKELVEKLHVKLDDIPEEKRDILCHKRVGLAEHMGIIDLKKEAENIRKQIEEMKKKQEEEMKKKQETAEKKPEEVVVKESVMGEQK